MKKGRHHLILVLFEKEVMDTIKNDSSCKYTTIESYRWNHKAGNNRKHLGILGPRNIGGNGPISGCNIRGGLDRYWN